MQLWRFYYQRHACIIYRLSPALYQRCQRTGIRLLRYDCQSSLCGKSDFQLCLQCITGFSGKEKSILLFNAFFALSFFIIIFSDNNYMLALSFFLTGMARGATSNFCNQSINELAPGKASLLNGLHAMFAIGAFTFPLLLIALTKNNPENWIYACYFMLIMGILSWIMYFIIPNSEDFTTGTKEKTASGFAFFKEPLFYLCTLTMFFTYVQSRVLSAG